VSACILALRASCGDKKFLVRFQLELYSFNGLIAGIKLQDGTRRIFMPVPRTRRSVAGRLFSGIVARAAPFDGFLPCRCVEPVLERKNGEGRTKQYFNSPIFRNRVGNTYQGSGCTSISANTFSASHSIGCIANSCEISMTCQFLATLLGSVHGLFFSDLRIRLSVIYDLYARSQRLAHAV